LKEDVIAGGHRSSFSKNKVTAAVLWAVTFDLRTIW
jgi:hypothetical protein